MEVFNYLFWKNVYHNKWLYRIAFIYFFITSKCFRNEVRLIRGIIRVEFQDQYRADMIEINKSINEIIGLLKDTTVFINNLNAKYADKPMNK